MKYQVFDCGKPADNKSHPEITGEGWNNSIFDTLEEAIEYAKEYFHPYQSPTEANVIIQWYDKEHTGEIRTIEQ